MRILTDVKEPRISVEWRKRTDFLPEILGGEGFLSDIIAALRLLLLRKKYDVIVLRGSRKGSLFAMLSALWPGKRVPILMIDCLWYKPQNWLLLWLKRFELQLIALAVVQFVVWASHEVRDYAAAFSVPEKIFLYIPFHHTLEGYSYEVTNGDYIFSGGDGDRDYPTLLEAVRGLDVQVVIATRRKDWNGTVSIPSSVEAFPVNMEDFKKWMAGSRMVVIPMEKGHLHSGGQQIYLNAMAMGKPVVVAEDKGAKDYIQNRVDGLIVPSGDVETLRIPIKSVLEDSRFADRLGNNAKKAYDTFSTPKCLGKILQTAEEIVLQNSSKR